MVCTTEQIKDAFTSMYKAYKSIYSHMNVILRTTNRETSKIKYLFLFFGGGGVGIKPFNINYNEPGVLQKPGPLEDSCKFRFRHRTTSLMHRTKLLNPMKKPFFMILATRILQQGQGSITSERRFELLQHLNNLPELWPFVWMQGPTLLN